VVRSLPISNYSDYTFVDIGSGKAVESVRRFRQPKIKCSQIECVLEDATRYHLPSGKLVVYVFNPFGADVMSQVLRRLDESAEQDPREIILVYVYPKFGSQMKTMRNFQIA